MIDYLEKNKTLLVYTPLIIYWITLFVATSIPAESVPSFGVGDKFNHFFGYLLLAVLLYLTFTIQVKSTFLKSFSAFTAVAVSSFYGVFDEIHQMYIPGRSAEFLDWLADAAGAICGVLIISVIIKKFSNKVDSA